MWLTVALVVVVVIGTGGGPGGRQATRRRLRSVAGPGRPRARWSDFRLPGTAQRADRRAEAQLPLLVDRVAWGLRSGAAVPQALVAAARDLPEPLAGELAECAASLRDGRPLREALDRWRRAVTSDARELVVTALWVAVQAGGAPAAALEGVAATVRDRQAVTREARALTAQARASVALLVVAPVAFGGLLATGDRTLWTFLTTDPLGVLCLIAGGALDAVGALWMRSVTRRAQSWL